MRISAYMLSCDQRAAVRERTLSNLRLTDWEAEPQIELDRESGELPPYIRMAKTVRQLLRQAISSSPEFVLFLEDDLRFNRHLRHNIDRWLRSFDAIPNGHFLGSLFNPSGFGVGVRISQTTFVVDEKCAFGSQAMLFSSATARHFLHHWDGHDSLHDFRMYHLAAMTGPIYCHAPSLVQHLNVPSTWGGCYARAPDFLADWRAAVSQTGEPAV
jgi:hypothetical protein